MVVLFVAYSKVCGALVGLLLTAGGGLVPAPTSLSSPVVSWVVSDQDPEARVVSILTRWYSKRATALVRADKRALARLYVADSALGKADQKVLDDLEKSGARVKVLNEQVISARLLKVEPPGGEWRRLEVEAVTRLAGGVVFVESHCQAVAAQQPRGEVIELAWAKKGWVMVEAQAV